MLAVQEAIQSHNDQALVDIAVAFDYSMLDDHSGVKSQQTPHNRWDHFAKNCRMLLLVQLTTAEPSRIEQVFDTVASQLRQVHRICDHRWSRCGRVLHNDSFFSNTTDGLAFVDKAVGWPYDMPDDHSAVWSSPCGQSSCLHVGYWMNIAPYSPAGVDKAAACCDILDDHSDRLCERRSQCVCSSQSSSLWGCRKISMRNTRRSNVLGNYSAVKSTCSMITAKRAR